MTWELFIGRARERGYFVTDFTHAWTVRMPGEPYTSVTFRDTDEEQPELREWIEGELVKAGAVGLDYFKCDVGWSLIVHSGISEARARSKTVCARDALYSVWEGA